VSNGTAEELLVHADSARMALQNYYMPILGGVQSFLAGTVTHGNTEGGNSNTTAATAAAAALAAVANAGRNGQLPLPLNDMDSIEFGVHFAAAAAAAAAAGVAMGGLGGLGMGLTGMNMTMGTGMVAGAGGGHGGSTGSSHGRDDEDEDGRGDGDYADHFRQPGNTKKRKVPANASGSPRGGDRPGSPSSPYMEDEGTEGALGGGAGFGAPSEELLRDRDRDRERDRDRDRDRGYESTPPPIYPPPPFPGQLSLLVRKRGKLTAVTLAGLQHKEMLKTRKRQLAAVMGALSHGDTLALDQALSASYPLVGGSDSSGSHGSVVGGRGASGESPPIRKSKRRTVRLARAMKVIMDMPERRNRHPDAVPFPTSVFDFVCPSGSECSYFCLIFSFVPARPERSTGSRFESRPFSSQLSHFLEGLHVHRSPFYFCSLDSFLSDPIEPHLMFSCGPFDRDERRSGHASQTIRGRARTTSSKGRKDGGCLCEWR